MTAEEVRAFLTAGARTGKLAWVAKSGQPHVAPIWFVVDDDTDGLEVVFNTGRDTAKGRALRRGELLVRLRPTHVLAQRGIAD